MLLIVATVFWVCGAAFAQLANPFIGTAGTGHVTPAAAAPFGLVQAGPDTSSSKAGFKGDWAHTSGYQFSDEYLFRFSQTHLFGTGVGSLGALGILPFSSEAIPDFAEIDKKSERAEPGFYRARIITGISCEVVSLPKCAVYRFDFGGKNASLLVDVGWGIANVSTNSPFGRNVLATGFRQRDGKTFTGRQLVRQWVEEDTHFVIKASETATSAKLVRKAEHGASELWRIDFGKPKNGVLELAIGLSLNSEDAALGNLQAEVPELDFAKCRAVAKKLWDDVFAKVELADSTPKETKEQFQSALYRLCIQPNNISDEGGETYSTFSLWDTFRAAHPLYTILFPEKAGAFARSMLEQFHRQGYLPIWALYGRENHCMVGHHSVPVIVDSYLKGLCAGIDAEELWKAIEDSLRNKHTPQSDATWGLLKEDWDLLDKYGYYPFDKLGRESWQEKKAIGESISRLLECTYDDWCAAQFAKALGKNKEAEYFLQRSHCWTNCFDTSTGFMRGKDSAGRWREPFDPLKCGSGPWFDNDFTEANAWQYTWHVLHEPETLFDLLGGKEKAVSKLDELFLQNSQVQGDDFTHDVSGLIGQYAHGNEPSHHITYLYALAGRPERTQELVRKIFQTQYNTGTDGLCGNDDCGQMAAWYIFSALGFYPVNPCGGEYILGAPQIPGATLNLPGGKQFKIKAENWAQDTPHVKRATLNGKEIKLKLRHSEIMAGGELVFEMAP